MYTAGPTRALQAVNTVDITPAHLSLACTWAIAVQCGFTFGVYTEWSYIISFPTFAKFIFCNHYITILIHKIICRITIVAPTQSTHSVPPNVQDSYLNMPLSIPVHSDTKCG